MKKLRQGRKVSRTLYVQQGAAPSDTDPIVGLVDTPELAARIVEAVNGADTKLAQVASQLADTRARIRALHAPEQWGPDNTRYCRCCGTMAPCNTLRALEDQ